MKRFLFFLLLLCATDLVAQRSHAVFQYTSREGMPQNSVRSLVFDQFGFLWMTTEAGIVRYDGNTFKSFGSNDFEGFSSDRFGQAVKMNDSTIVFSDQNYGIFQLQKNRFRTIRPSPDRQPGSINIRGGLSNTAFLSELYLSIAKRKYHWRWSSFYLHVFPIDGEKHLVVKDSSTLELYQKGKAVENISFPTLDPEAFFMIEGKLLAFNGKRELFQFDVPTRQFKPSRLNDATQGQWKNAPLKNFLFCSYPFDVTFLVHDNHLYKISKSTESDAYLLELVLRELPIKIVINQIAYRPEDHLLAIGTDAEGLFLFKEQFFTSIVDTSPEQGTNNAYYAQAVLNNDVILCSYQRMFETKGANPAMIGTFPHRFVNDALFKDSSGMLWHSSMDTLRAYDTRSPQNGLKYFRAQSNPASYLQGPNQLWCGSKFGIGYVSGDSIKYLDRTVSQYNNNPPQVMCFDQEGNIWYGVINNLYRFNPQTNKVDSFPLFANKTVRALRLIGDKLFVGTYGHGYFVYTKGHFYQMPVDKKNVMVHIHAFIPDANGFLWMSTNRGLYKTKLTTIEQYLKDTTTRVYYYVYREEDGIRNAEFNGGCSPTYVVLSDGRVSLPTMGGLVLFQPNEIPHAIPRDTILIETFRVDGNLLDLSQNISVPANHQSVEVNVSTPWWHLPDNLILEYKLEGLHSTWLDAGFSNNLLVFGRLSPGTHTLILRKRCGFESDAYTVTRLVFKVQYPWYLQWWALLTGIVAALVLLWLVIFLYTRSVRHRNLMLQQKVDSQTRELKKTNDYLVDNLHKLEASESELRQSLRIKNRLITIFSHDILTPLRFIGMIARFAIPPKSRADVDDSMAAALKDIRNASEKLFEHTQNILNWIKYQDKHILPELTNSSPFAITEQLLEDFSELAQFRGNRLVNEVPEDDVIRTDPKILTIILHNLLSNALKFTQKGVITVRGIQTKNQYLLTLTDTGRGMTETQLQQLRNDETVENPVGTESVTAGNSLGFSLVKELLAVLGGAWEIKSAVGEGVTVRIKLPLL